MRVSFDRTGRGKVNQEYTTMAKKIKTPAAYRAGGAKVMSQSAYNKMHKAYRAGARTAGVKLRKGYAGSKAVTSGGT